MQTQEVKDTQEKNNNQEENKNQDQEAINNRSENENQGADTNQDAYQQQQDNTQTDERKSHYSLNLAILGGIVGAGIGLLANPETSKKVVKNLGDSELIKVAGQEFRKTAQELLAGQAQNSIKQLASGYLSKIEEGLLSPKKDKGGSNNSDQESQQYEAIKQENKNLNDRLQKIEKMLNELVESK
ncbi:GvpT/GvpP family gas vesicle accessory protein [Peribacillus sp. SCS-155]|uniref:GvpT/GvpP family gas vesicle accessory protein n=1 Tax=Peribacillus sedimenti TaxID=3115297 RepID=UPI003906646D